MTAVFQPWPMKLLVDSALGNQPAPPPVNALFAFFAISPDAVGLIIFAAVASLGLYGLNSALDVGLTWAWSAAGQGMVYDLSRQVFQRLQRLSLLFHQDRTVGDALSRLNEDTYCVYTLTSALLVDPAQHLFTLASVGVLAWQLDPFLTLLCFALAPLMGGSALFFGARLKRRTRRNREATSRLLSFVHQTLTAIPMVQAFGTEARNGAQFRTLADEAVMLLQRGTLVNSTYGLVNGSVITFSTALVLYFGGRQVLFGTMTVGSLLVLLAYLRLMQSAFYGLLTTYGQMKSTEANLERVLEVLETEPMVQDSPMGRPLPSRVAGQVQFKGVTFGYQSGTPTLRDIDLEVLPGETIALVGATGAGKSTLVSLLPRFFDPWQGSILLDGIDLRQIQLKSLRSQISLVLQDPFLLPLSIANNIAYGLPAAARSQIIRAAELANADEFIRHLPQGYDTVIGERGATLSGGQKQRLSIARALLKDAPILLLDEPTSALDVATEASIMGALQQLMAGRTTFIIAHRLSTVQRADRIVVLDQGRIAEVGTHQALLDRQGLYFRLHSAQALKSLGKTLGRALS
jgi:ATP-binding cassette subfamily B protein/subfamily B ATP-binding cassette protein MsbA